MIDSNSDSDRARKRNRPRTAHADMVTAATRTHLVIDAGAAKQQHSQQGHTDTTLVMVSELASATIRRRIWPACSANTSTRQRPSAEDCGPGERQGAAGGTFVAISGPTS